MGETVPRRAGGGQGCPGPSGSRCRRTPGRCRRGDGFRVTGGVRSRSGLPYGVDAGVVEDCLGRRLFAATGTRPTRARPHAETQPLDQQHDQQTRATAPTASPRPAAIPAAKASRWRRSRCHSARRSQAGARRSRRPRLLNSAAAMPSIGHEEQGQQQAAQRARLGAARRPYPAAPESTTQSVQPSRRAGACRGLVRSLVFRMRRKAASWAAGPRPEARPRRARSTAR